MLSIIALPLARPYNTLIEIRHERRYRCAPKSHYDAIYAFVLPRSCAHAGNPRRGFAGCAGATPGHFAAAARPLVDFTAGRCCRFSHLKRRRCDSRRFGKRWYAIFAWYARHTDTMIRRQSPHFEHPLSVMMAMMHELRGMRQKIDEGQFLLGFYLWRRCRRFRLNATRFCIRQFLERRHWSGEVPRRWGRRAAPLSMMMLRRFGHTDDWCEFGGELRANTARWMGKRALKKR